MTPSAKALRGPQITRINKSPRIPRAFVLVGSNVITSVRQYLDRVTNMLLDKRNENATVDIKGPRWISQKNNRVAVVFGARLEFESGHVLEISDDFLIEASGDEWSRKFAYFFGAPNGDER